MNRIVKSIVYMGFVTAVTSLFLFVSCGKTSVEELNSRNAQEGYRCVLEVWTEHPTEISFWGCTWYGSLTQDGKKIPSDSPINVLKDLGKHPLKDKHYKTEFISSQRKLLTINFWISHNKMLGIEPLKVSYKAWVYSGNKLIKEEEEKDYPVGILGKNFQVSVLEKGFIVK